MNNKKNRLWTFVFSLIPGAGEMYFGLYRQGISLMLTFLALLFIPIAINLSVFCVLAIVVWFYSFLHVHNMRHMPVEEFLTTEDKCVWEGLNIQFRWNSTYKLVVALLLIVAGVFLLWNNFIDLLWYILPNNIIADFFYSLTYRLPRIVIALIIIFLGVKLIGGKKKEMEQEEEADCVEYTDIPVLLPEEDEEVSDENA